MNLHLLYPRYVELKKVDEVFARRCILRAYENLKSISKVSRLFRTTRKTVRSILKRYKSMNHEGLKDMPKRPKRSPKRTPYHIEVLKLSERKRTNYGRDRISRILKERGIDVKPSTVRYVLKRYGLKARYKRSRYRKRKRFYDFEELYPLSHFEVDLKEIYDKETLQEEAIRYAKSLNIPPYQWGSYRCEDKDKVFKLLL